MTSFLRPVFFTASTTGWSSQELIEVRSEATLRDHLTSVRSGCPFSTM